MSSVIVFLVVVTIVVCVVLNTYGINVFKKLGGLISKLFKSEKKEKKEKKPKEKEKKKDKQSSIDDAIPVSKINKAEDKKKSATKIMKPVEEDKLRSDIADKIDEDSKKAKGVPLGGGKVEKVTKEDFQKNSIVLPPSSNLSDQPFENFSKSKADDDDFSFMKDFGGGDPFGSSSSMPRSSKSSVDDLDLDALLRELEEESKNDMPGISGDYNEDPFGVPKFGESFESPMLKKTLNPFEDDSFQEVSSLSELDDDEDDELDFAPSVYDVNYAGASSGGFITKSIGDRYDAVFGSGSDSVKNKIAKEIIVGDIISGPRARSNRMMRREWDRRKNS